jgi:hypothetical protein
MINNRNLGLVTISAFTLISCTASDVEQDNSIFLSCSGILLGSTSDTMIPMPFHQTYRLKIDTNNNTVGLLSEESGQFKDFCSGYSDCSVSIESHEIRLSADGIKFDINRMDGKMNISIGPEGDKDEFVAGGQMLCIEQSKDRIIEKAF